MNSLIEALNVWGDHALRFAWPMLWQSSLLIGLLFALDLLTRRKLRPAVRYALWLVVLVKLLLPPSLAFPTGPGWWLRPAKAAPARPRPTTTVVVTYDAHDMPAPSLAPAPVFIAPPPPRPRLTPASWTLVGMTAVSLGLLAWMLVRWFQVAREARRASAAPAWLNQLIPVSLSGEGRSRREEALTNARTPDLQGNWSLLTSAPTRDGSPQRHSELRSPVRLKLTDHPLSPAVCGLFRPVILLPRSLVEQLPPAQLRAVLLHELLHLRRGDVWVNCAQALLQIAYWWHPLLWLANARIRRVREEAVDDAVMLALKEDADTYAPTLLEVAKLALRRPLASLGLVGILESRSALRQRIERLMDFRPPRKAGLTVGSALAVLGFAALAVPMGAAPVPPEAPQPERVHAAKNSSASDVPSDTGVLGRKNQTSALAQDGKLLYETDKLNSADAKLQESLNQDPQDQTSPSYLRLAQDPTITLYPERKEVLTLLNSIQLDRLAFDGLPLGEVLHSLFEEARKRDPRKLGLNFIINPPDLINAASAAAMDPPTGLPKPPTPATPLDLATIPITINPPLTNIHLLDALDAIVKVAGQPIQYSIESYAVEFSAITHHESPPLYVRSIKVDPSLVVQGLHLANFPIGATGWAAATRALVDYFARAGADVDPTRNPGKALFINDRQGIILVRATLGDLDIIEREIAALGAPAEQAPAPGPVHPSAASQGVTNGSVSDGQPNPGLPMEQRIKASTLVHDGKLLYELGKLDEAESKLKLALKTDPRNEAAYYYLNLVSEAKSRRASPIKRELLPVPNPYNRSNLIHNSLGRQAIITKLDRIRLESVSFDGLPLTAVVRFLADESRKRDPDKRGINFLVNQPVDSGATAAAATLGPDGQPLPAAPAEQVDVGSIAIKISPPLTDIRLADVLDAIVKVADRPIKYSIEDYAIVFSLKTRETTPLYVRSFKVDPNTFYQGLQRVGAFSLGNATNSGSGSSDLSFATQNNATEVVSRAAMNYFQRFGVNLDSKVYPSKSIFFNDRQGMLLVRGTLQDLDIIEVAIQGLNIAPPQVNIKCKIVEISQEDTKALGFDWFLGNLITNSSSTGGQVGVAPSFKGVPTAANPQGVFPANPTTGTSILPGANAEPLTSGLNPVGTSPLTLTGVLTDPQYRMVIKALQQRTGAQLLAQPEITTQSGRQAQCRSMSHQAVAKGINKQALTPPGITSTNNEVSAVFETEPMEFGVSLDLVPTVMEDGYTINLPVVATALGFLGYDDHQTNHVAVYLNGQRQWATPPRPKVQKREVAATVNVRDGETLVLGSLAPPNLAALVDQMPMLGDLPLVRRMLQSGEYEITQKRNLLVFVTPTIIDPAGNRLHSEDEMPFTRDGTPQQPTR